MIKIEHWLKKLGVDPETIKKTSGSTDGIRQYLTGENDKYVFSISKTLKPQLETFGISNRCSDGKYVLFGDYDNIYKSVLYKNLDALSKFGLGNFFIAKTKPETVFEDGDRKGSYHVVNFSKLNLNQINQYLAYMNVDPDFNRIRHLCGHKCNVLRIDYKYWRVSGRIVEGKPKFSEIYPDTYTPSLKMWSLAHYKMFKEAGNYKDPFFNQRAWDNSTRAEMHKYKTYTKAK